MSKFSSAFCLFVVLALAGLPTSLDLKEMGPELEPNGLDKQIESGVMGPELEPNGQPAKVSHARKTNAILD